MRFPAAVRASLCLLAVACGGGSPSGTPDLGSPDVPEDQAPPVPSIETLLDATTIKAGQWVQVSCSGFGFDRDRVELVVQEVAAPPAQDAPAADPGASPTTQDAAQADVPPDLPPDLTLPAGVTRDGMRLRFERTGPYLVACFASDADLLDPTPARLLVRPGTAATIDTAVDREEVKAGEWVVVTCSGQDMYGNPLESEMVPVVTPPGGVQITGLTFQPTRAGEVQVACAVKDTSLQDQTPARVRVIPNLPRRIVTLVDPLSFPAGESATITCRVTDGYDNPVSDLPVSIQVPLGLQLAGRTLTSTQAGVYTVRCVPQTAEWKYFTLVPATVTVEPGTPVAIFLDPVPRKPYYGRNEQLTVNARIEDAWGNLLPEARVQAPVEISPPRGIVPSTQSPTRVFTMKEEGVYRMTFRVAGAPQVFAELEVRVEGSGPLLTLIVPERGLMLGGDKPSLTLEGQVHDDQTGITRFRVNGQEASLKLIRPDGTFTYLLSPLKQGLNVVTVEVENGAGIRSSATRGFYYSPKWRAPQDRNPADATIPEAIKAFLSKEFVDDQDHSMPPDDLATLLEVVFANLNLAAMLPNPLASAGPYQVKITRLRYDKPRFDLSLLDGGMVVRMEIPNIDVGILAVGQCNFIIDWCPDVSGTISLRRLLAIAQMDVGMTAQGKPRVSVRTLQVQLGGLDVNIDGILGDLLDFLVDLLVDAFTETLRRTLETQVKDLLNSTLGGLFDQLTIDQSIDIPALPGGQARSIRLVTRPTRLDVHGEGIVAGLDTSIGARKGITRDPLGSIGRAGCLQPGYDSSKPDPYPLPWDPEVDLVAYDDLLNEALFALWYAGSLNLRLTAGDLGDTDLSQYGVDELRSVMLDFYLPPILTDCQIVKDPVNPAPPGLVQAHLGDLYVFADLTLFGSPLQLGLFVQANAEAVLSLSRDPATGEARIGVALRALPVLDIEVVSINEDFPLTSEDLMGILQGQVLDQLLAGVLGKELVSFALPAIDLSALEPSLPQGLTIRIDLSTLKHEKGNTVVTGRLVGVSQ
ncbi:hypothetical protein KBD49_02180 [Myxococcota bacterium]|jgi:hypothetical protein|nr:hypothetical protein [Myxococcota bacterium]